MEEKITALLVDDEKLERVLIRQGFPWEEKGFVIIGEVESGKEALEFIRHRRPDIVLTDISMPNMSGLELAERIAAEDYECHVVIITGYREFEYARAAVKLGVEDFLLKPVNMDEIGKITEKIKKKISENKEKLHAVEKLKESLSAQQDILMESFLQRLVENRISEEKAASKLMVYGCEGLKENCGCLNISVKEENGQLNLSDWHKAILEYLEEKKPKDCVYFVHYMHNIILLFMDGDKDTPRLAAKNLYENLLKEKIEATIGIGSLCHGFSGIWQAYLQSEKALGASVLLGQNRIIEYSDYLEIMEKNQKMPEFSWEDFSFSLTNVIRDKAEQALEDYYTGLKNTRAVDIEYLRWVTLDILSRAGDTLSKYGTNLFQLAGEEQLYQKIRNIQTLEQSRELVSGCIDMILKYHDSKKMRQGNRVVEQALSYVDGNYCDPELTLTMVAEKVFANESYLSRVFKKEVGQSLIEYVTKLRIEESIRLLNTTDLKVYEVAEKVGFRDSHYFSICFKKQVGVTVKDFRKR